MKFGFIIEDGPGEEGQRWRMKMLMPQLESMGSTGVIFPGNVSKIRPSVVHRMGTLTRTLAVKRHGVDILFTCADPKVLKRSLGVARASGLPLVILEDRTLSAKHLDSLPQNSLRLSPCGANPALTFFPLPPDPSLGTIPDGVRQHLRKRLGLDDGRFVIYCPNSSISKELNAAREALLHHNIFTWLTPCVPTNKKKDSLRPFGISQSEAMAVADATYIQGDGPWAVCALLSSFAAERPALLQATPGSPASRLLERSKGGLFFSPKEKNSLQVGAFSLHADEKLRQRMAQSSGAFLHQHYSWEEAARVLSAIQIPL